MNEGHVPRRWRTIALVAIGIAIGSTIAATPVYSHVGGTVSHLWTKHIRPQTDARYYTKAQADGRYLPAGGKAADANLLDGLDSGAFLPATGKAADANLLDGVDSSLFLRTTGKAADAELLDGLDSAVLQRTCRTGTIHAVALIRGDADYPTTFTDVTESFSCWRGSGKVAARRVAEGRYQVILSGAPFNSFCLSAPLVIGSIQNDASDNNFFTYSAIACGGPLETRIEVTNTSSGGNLQDGLITLAWYRIL